jgi:L-threonylcarbamoyladenylate synthase
MMSRINVTPDNREEAIAEAARVLRRGGIVAFPTDTVYGLGALAFRERAVSRLYEAKGRPQRLAIPVLISRISDLKRVARQIPPAAWRLAGAFWPGGLSLVLLKRAIIPNIVTANGPSVAVRIPNHSLAIRIIEAAGAPLAVTSANVSGQPSAITADEVMAALGDKVDLLLDGGACPGGVASTVVDMTQFPPRILRQGPIEERDLSPLWADQA